MTPWSGEKIAHGPVLTDWLGSPAGRQGIPAPAGRISAPARGATGSMAVEASNARLRVIHD